MALIMGNTNMAMTDGGGGVSPRYKKPVYYIPRTTNANQPSTNKPATGNLGGNKPATGNLGGNQNKYKKPTYNPRVVRGSLGKLAQAPMNPMDVWARNYGGNVRPVSNPWAPPGSSRPEYQDRTERMNNSQAYQNYNPGFWGAYPEFDFNDQTKAALGLEVYNPNWRDDYNAYIAANGNGNDNGGEEEYYYEDGNWGGGGYGGGEYYPRYQYPTPRPYEPKPSFRGMNDVNWRI